MTMRDELTAILGLSERQRRVAEVRRYLGGGRYRLRDALGRVLYAESDARWRRGETVAVLGGRIVGSASAARAIETVTV